MSNDTTSPAAPESPKPAPKKKVASKVAVKSSPKEVKNLGHVLIPFGAFLLGLFLASLIAYFVANSKEAAANKASAEASKEIAVCEASLKTAKSALVPAPIVNNHSVNLQPVIGKVEEICGPKPVVVAKSSTPRQKIVNHRPASRKQEYKSPQQSRVMSSSEMHLLWRAHDSTPSNPKPCFISGGDGAGLPPYCSKFSVKTVNNGETKDQWLVRVGGGHRPTDTGMYTRN